MFSRSAPLLGRAIFVSLLGTLASSCATSPPPAPPRAVTTVTGEQLSLAQLQQMTYGFADSYVVTISSACDEIERHATTPQQRRRAQELKLYSATSAFDIVTNADPFTQLLDLTSSITLQSYVWIDENRAEEAFGEQGVVLVRAMRRARVDVWDMAAKVMKPEQLQLMDYLIWDWRKTHPEVEQVQFVRFDNFSASRGKSSIAEVKTGSGLLAPVNEAIKSIDETRLLAERAFYLSKRAPLLIDWQVHSISDGLLANPQVSQTIEKFALIADTADRVGKAVDRLPEQVATERKAILAAIDDRQHALNATIDNAKASIVEAQKLASTGQQIVQEIHGVVKEANDSLKVTQGLLDRYEKIAAPAGGAGPNPAASTQPAKAFDINEYAAAANELAKTARELNGLLKSAGTLVESDVWSRRIDEINHAADERVRLATTETRAILDSFFHRVYLLMAMFFGLLVLYKLFTVRLSKPATQRPNIPPGAQ